MLATVVARYVFVTPRTALTLTTSITPAGKLKLVGQLIDALQTYVDQLPAGDAATGAAMLAAINAVPELKAANPRFLDVLAARADINDPGTQPLVEALVAAVQVAPATDAATLTTAIGNVLSSDVQPLFSENRIPDRTLVVGKSGQATDDEIEAGTFSVVLPPPQNGEKWSIALEMSASDVQVAGG